MPAAVRRGSWLTVAALVAVGGCATSRPVPIQLAAPPRPALELPLVSPGSLEPDPRSLPSVDPTTLVVSAPGGFRGVSEELCGREAALRATTPRLFENEPHDCVEFLGEARTLLAAEARNRAAHLALENFFQLADAQGRGDLVRKSLPVLDRLRGIAHKARADGLRIPVDPDDLDRQHALVLGQLSQAELGATVFDIELKRRIGYPGGGTDRLSPTGPFPVSDQPLDVEAAVQVGLQQRAELRLLRAAYWRLSPATLQVVRGLLTQQPGTAGLLGTAPDEPGRSILTRRRSAATEAAARAEVELRRRQLYDLIADRERQTADEVRAAAAAVTAQARQVALTRWRIEQLQRKAAEVADQGPLVALPAELELYRARADGITAVMSWHQARVRFLAAQGLLGDASSR